MRIKEKYNISSKVHELAVSIPCHMLIYLTVFHFGYEKRKRKPWLIPKAFIYAQVNTCTGSTEDISIIGKHVQRFLFPRAKLFSQRLIVLSPLLCQWLMRPTQWSIGWNDVHFWCFFVCVRPTTSNVEIRHRCRGAVSVAGKGVHSSGLKMKSSACRSAAATLGCQRSTLKMARGPSSGGPGPLQKRHASGNVVVCEWMDACVALWQQHVLTSKGPCSSSHHFRRLYDVLA